MVKEHKSNARKLRDEGMSCRRIAGALGISYTSVRRLVDDGYAHRDELQRREYNNRPERRLKKREASRGCVVPIHLIEETEKNQEYRCAICGIEKHEALANNSTGWCVDHDHKTGMFRGMLCSKCNIAIGMLQDSPSLLWKAAEYLYKSQVKVVPLG